ncbi:hypothetical protein MVEN_02239600 [Mycena venus]|uniref:Uncharacterized protein n=1 Tax=Mycena venus TaxID=2733690 RepID=A0A8H7CHP5_9AGAR|nr:hypothetical protein MVEN_02239600 [Mycena venus]
MNQFRVVVRQPLVAASPGSSFGPTGKLKAKPPKAYNTSEELLTALRKTCIEDPEVDFSGSYVVSGNDADTVSDKQRVQMVTNDIWKATGYRFTVKDHPPTERGHKTRLWCSQDEARRSKHRGNSDAPRMSKQGELFAKQRFPCRSRLMITCLPPGGEGSRGEGAGGRVVTIRMHHYMRHEAYLESAAEATNNGVEPVEPPPLMSFLGTINAPLPPVLMGMTMDMRGVGRGDIELPRAVPVAPPPPLHEQEGEWEMSHAHHDQQESPPEPAPPSPSPSPALRPPPPAPARLPIDPQLEGLAHHHRPPPPPSHSNSQHSPPFQHPSHPQQPVPSHPSQQHPPQHPSQHPPTIAPASPHHRTSIPHHRTSILHRRSIPLSLPPQPTQQQHSHPPQHTHPPPQHPPPQHQHQHPPPPIQLTPEEFQHRMRTHIARIRDFADGLEYQVQFNDYRMLEALERDAAPFIDFLQDCLRREGRLA